MDEIVQADVLPYLRMMPDEGIDCIMTSPPYYGLRSYGEEGKTVWDSQPGCEHQWNSDIKVWHSDRGEGPRKEVYNDTFQSQGSEHAYCSGCGAWHGQLGLEPDFHLYLKHMLDITLELKRVLKKTGTLWLNIGDTYASSLGNHGGKTAGFSPKTNVGDSNRPPVPKALEKSLCLIPERLSIGLQEQGWRIRNMNIWRKPNHMPSSVRDRFTSSYEFLIFAVKDKRYYFDLDAVREKHSEGTFKWIRQSTIMTQMGGAKQDALHPLPTNGELKGNYNRGSQIVQSLARKLSAGGNGDVQQAPKWGEPTQIQGDVFQSYQGKFEGFGAESEHYGSPRARTQRLKFKGQYQTSKDSPWANIARKRDEVREREGVEPSNPNGKNPGDVFQAKKEPYLANNPHTMRLNPQEHLALETSRPSDLSHHNGKNPGDFWSINTRPFKGAHFAVYPEALCERPIKAGSPRGGVVLDPFAGSGTTCVVAKRLGRHFLGVEINPAYCEIARKRLEAVPWPLDMYVAPEAKS